MEAITKSQYYKIIQGTLQEEKVIDKTKIPSDFPKNSSIFGKELDYIKHVLNKEGIYIYKERNKIKRIIKVTKTPVTRVTPSPIDEKVDDSNKNLPVTNQFPVINDDRNDRKVTGKNKLPSPIFHDDNKVVDDRNDRKNTIKVSTEKVYDKLKLFDKTTKWNVLEFMELLDIDEQQLNSLKENGEIFEVSSGMVQVL